MEEKKNTILNKTKDLIYFLTNDLWRTPKHEVKGIESAFLNTIRTIVLAVRDFIGDRLSYRASALTYTSLLAVVPIFALVIGIGRGFGFQQMIEKQVTNMIPGQTKVLSMIFNFVDSYLNAATSGIIVGIGIVFLISSIWVIIQNIETTFNDIFQIKSHRSFSRRLVNYLATMLLIPILIILTSGISIYINSAIGELRFIQFLSPIVNLLVSLSPYFISWITLTFLYLLLPNTKVKFSNAVIGGFISGLAFQGFQLLYISGQIWVNRYSAIYGSFAAIPLFLLWLKSSWIIVLFGAELTYASQNVSNFYYEKEVKNVSHRFRYFIAILIMNTVCKRFEEEKPPLALEQISQKYQIPSRLTKRSLNQLVDMGLISETISESKKETITYQPGIDINKITIAFLFKKMFEYGSEDFQIDQEEEYKIQWDTIKKLEENIKSTSSDILIKDL